MKKEKLKKDLLYFFLYVVLVVIAFIYMVPIKFHVNTFEQVLFHLGQPMGDAGPHIIWNVAQHIFWKSLFSFLGILIISAAVHKIITKTKRKFSVKYIFKINDGVYRKIIAVWLAVSAVFMVVYGVSGFKIISYLKNANKPYSMYYEHNYVYPRKENIKFPKKNNLIIIHLESIEKCYCENEVFDSVITPNIAELRRENLSFKGYKQVFGTGWTIGGIFSGYCGIPLNVVINQNNDYGRFEDFFANIKCMPEILKDNGYRTCYMQGAALAFAGKDKFFSQHGMDEVYGKDEFFMGDDFKEEYEGDWGVNDHALFKYAKEKINKMSKKKGPFLFSMLTVDTHNPGFLNPVCEKKYDIHLKNVVACSDKLVGDFMEWLKKQDFYKNTTIVILGDHLAMNCELRKQHIQDPNREIVNIFINPVKTTKNTDRTFTAFDLMPTIIESIGGEIKGGRLGLGTSLFCGRETLIERDGQREFDEKIYEKSRLYESFR